MCQVMTLVHSKIPGVELTPRGFICVQWTSINTGGCKFNTEDLAVWKSSWAENMFKVPGFL